MAEIYGHRWISAYGEDPEGSAALTWGKGLAGMSGAQLAAGLAACVASAEPWPPTLPEFRALCLGIPSLAAVKLELRGEGVRSGFTVLVGSLLDGARFRAAPADQADRLLQEAYQLARTQVMCGGQIPAAAGGKLQKPAPAPVHIAAPEVGQAYASALREEMGWLERAPDAEPDAEEVEVSGKDAAAGPDR